MKGLVAMLATLACCGDNHPGAGADGGPVDASVDAPLDAFVACNYTEMDDLGNGDLYGGEPTPIMFKPGDTRTICGAINNGHYTDGTIDLDDYSLTVTQDSDVLVTLIADAAAIPTLGTVAFDDQSMVAVGFGYYVGDHAVYSAHLPADRYELSVDADGNADIAAPIPYKLRIQTDHPTLRCPTVTTAADYTEANDGTNSNMNDVFAIDATAVTLIASTAAEPTNLSIADSTNYRIDGVSASVLVSGTYFDRDTYAITATSDQLAIRLDWTSANDDLDFYIFTPSDANEIDKPGATTVAKGGDEFATQAVNPGSVYWVWVGASQDSTDLPTNYSLSICGETGVTGP
jgi:hypothetical protein